MMKDTTKFLLFGMAAGVAGAVLLAGQARRRAEALEGVRSAFKSAQRRPRTFRNEEARVRESFQDRVASTILGRGEPRFGE